LSGELSAAVAKGEGGPPWEGGATRRAGRDLWHDSFVSYVKGQAVEKVAVLKQELDMARRIDMLKCHGLLGEDTYSGGLGGNASLVAGGVACRWCLDGPSRQGGDGVGRRAT
jgi:hypothetical protein